MTCKFAPQRRLTILEFSKVLGRSSSPLLHSLVASREGEISIHAMDCPPEEAAAVTEKESEPPPDGGLKAWAQVFMGHLILINSWGYLTSFGLFESYYIGSLHATPSAHLLDRLGPNLPCLFHRFLLRQSSRRWLLPHHSNCWLYPARLGGIYNK